MTELTSPARLEACRRDARMIAVLFAACAIGFQIAVTVAPQGVPLRIVLADLVMPVGLIACAAAGLLSLRTQMPYFWLWVAGLTVWIAVALVHGRIATGTWITWAVLHRGLGWFVLMGYVVLGLTLAAHASHRTLRLFVSAFAATILVGTAWSWLSLVAVGSGYTGVFSIPFSHRVEGWMQNPNAFGILCVAGVACWWGLMARKQSPLSTNWSATILGLLLFSAFAPQSRSAWLGLFALVMVGLVVARLPWKALAIAGVVAVAAGLLFTYLTTIIWYGASHLQDFGSSVGSSVVQTQPALYSGFNTWSGGPAHRLEMSWDAIERWQQNPIIGIGLGAFYHQDLVARGPGQASALHTSLLWILTEMGLVGALLFSGFVLTIASIFLKRQGPIQIGGLLALVGLAVASIGTEVLYQRYIWFLIGLGLALPARGAKSATTSAALRST